MWNHNTCELWIIFSCNWYGKPENYVCGCGNIDCHASLHKIIPEKSRIISSASKCVERKCKIYVQSWSYTSVEICTLKPYTAHKIGNQKRKWVQR